MFILILITLLTILVCYYKWSYQYWKNKNLPFLQPRAPFGNLPSPIRRKENPAITMKKFYDEIKTRGWKHAGVYFITAPVYFIVDLEYVKNILTRDFQYFVARGFYYNEKDDPLSANVFAVGNPKWRHLRVKLTPTFTSGKMKMMFQELLECAESLEKKMLLEYNKRTPLDVKEICGCFTTNVIGSCAFGLDCASFKDENSPFRVYGKKTVTSDEARNIKSTFGSSFPNFSRKLGLITTPSDVIDFFFNLVKDTVLFRETNNVTRKDFLQLLIDLKNDPNPEDGKAFTIEDVAAQCFIFFLAGFETSSTAMSFALYLLAKNQNIQEKVRQEINTVLAKHGGKITYQSIKCMKYLDQVIDETLRKYPPLSFLTRECVKDYKLPDDDVIIEKGTLVVLSLLGIHHDEEYYPDPEKFDPERFSEENKALRHPYAHIPFGEGPRMCIGMRFGLMQTKVGLVTLLKNYKFSLNGRTEEPLRMKPSCFVLEAEGEIWLDAEKL